MIDPESYRAGLEAAAWEACRSPFGSTLVADAIRALPVPVDPFVAIRVRNLEDMSVYELRDDIRRLERILQYLAAQSSGIPGGTTQADCMATFASMALRGQG